MRLDQRLREKYSKELNQALQEATGTKSCPPHSWSYHPVSGKLVCIEAKCGLVAGETKTENGEY